MRQDKPFGVRKFIVRQILDAVLVEARLITESLLEKKPQVVVVLLAIGSFFAFIYNSQVATESHRVEERQKLSDFLPK